MLSVDFPLDVVEECGKVMVDALAAALAVQEDLGCLIAHQECRLFLARLMERVESSPPVEWVERADEDDVRPAQLRVELLYVRDQSDDKQKPHRYKNPGA